MPRMRMLPRIAGMFRKKNQGWKFEQLTSTRPMSEDVINGLKCRRDDNGNCKKCKYYGNDSGVGYCDFTQLMDDAIYLLKER